MAIPALADGTAGITLMQAVAEAAGSHGQALTDFWEQRPESGRIGWEIRAVEARGVGQQGSRSTIGKGSISRCSMVVNTYESCFQSSIALGQ